MIQEPANQAGRCRCWETDDPLFAVYRDEWGVPVRDDRLLFEQLVLSGFQAGLSWRTILYKRENFRRAFHNFEADRVARYGARDRRRLLADAGIIRNRQKIDAAINNAKAVLTVGEEFGAFSNYLWDFVGGRPESGSLSRVRRAVQGSPNSRIQFCRLHHCVCVHARCRIG